MSHVSLRRSLLALPLLSLTLGPSAASAAPIHWGNFLAEEGRSALHFLESVLLGDVHVSPRTPKAGCTINPNDQPQCEPAPKLGCSINPDGQPQCAPAVTPKRGCAINPDGITVCTP